MAETVNAQLVDALTRHAIETRQSEEDLADEIAAILALLLADLLASIRQADPTEPDVLTRRRRAVEQLVDEELTPLITSRYRRIAGLVTDRLVALAQEEASAVQDLVNEVTADEAISRLPSDAALRRAVTQTLIPTVSRPTEPSATGDEWWARQADSLTQRLRDQLLVGVTQEETTRQLEARLRGTQEQGFADGLMERARTDARRLLTTQTTNALSEASVAVGAANARRVVLMHQSVLDGKTSLI